MQSPGRAQPFPLLSLATESRARAWEGLGNTGKCPWGWVEGDEHRKELRASSFSFVSPCILKKLGRLLGDSSPVV